MLTAKAWNKINKGTFENCCMENFHMASDQFWMSDVLYCACGAIIGDRNMALKKGTRVWAKTKKKLGLEQV